MHIGNVQSGDMDLDDGLVRFLAQTKELCPPDSASLPADKQRAFYNCLCARFARPRPERITTSDRTIAGPGGAIEIRVYEPAEAERPPVVLYLHGGGFVVGNLESHDSICAEIADQADSAVVAVDYRLAPENRFPAALDDCRAVLHSIKALSLIHGFDASRLVLAGDSAGGNLAASLTLDARDNAGPPVAGQVLIYPALAQDTSQGSYIERANAPDLTTDDVRYYHGAYIGQPGDANYNSKFAYPLLETDYSGLPPAFIAVAEWDPLRDDGIHYAQRLAQAGVPARLRREPRLVHGYLRARFMSESAGKSFQEIVAAIASLGHKGALPSD